MILTIALLTAHAAAARATPAKAQPKPAPPSAFEGVVKDPQGKPVEKALVVAACSTRGDPPLLARTDPQGHFRFERVGFGPCTVRVEARGLAPARLERVRPGTPLAIALENGRAIEGIIRDGGSGQPIAGARVEAGTGGRLTWEPGTGGVEAVTDAKGHYRIDGLGRGVYEVTASGHGYGRARKAGVTPGARVDLFLFPGASVTGTIQDPDQKPIAGVVVRVEREDPPWSGDAPPSQTNARGRFEVFGVEPGQYRIAVWRSGYGAVLMAGVQVEGAGETPIALTLAPATAVTGRLLGANGRPLAGRVSLQELNGTPVPRSLEEVLRAQAGADGRFRLEGIPSGAHALTAVAPRHARKRVEFEAGAKRAADVGDVTLDVGLALRGRVRDKAGLPIAGAQVFGLRQRMDDDPRPVDAESEADGTFVVAGMAEGTYEFSISAPGYGSVARQAEASTERLDVVLFPGGALAGLVVDDAGGAVEAYSLEADHAGDRFAHGSLSEDVATPDGRFLLDELAEGVYVLRVSAPARAATVLSGLKVAPGTTTDVGRIRLEPGGVLKGSVSDSEGAPVAGATVLVFGAGQRWENGSEPQAVTDLAGSFEVRGVPIGSFHAVAHHPEFADGRVTGLEVDPAKGPTETRFVLGKGARLVGWARKRDGTPIPDATVEVWASRGEGDFTSAPTTVHIRADGTFAADHLQPGRTQVHVMQGSSTRRVGIQSKTVVLQEGETTSVDLSSREIRVSGRVTRGGVPAPRLRVTFEGDNAITVSMGAIAPVPASSTGPQHLTAVTGDDGAYELIVDDSGAFGVEVETLDGRTRYPSKDVDVPDAEAWSLDMDLVGSPVAGVVVDGETGQPIAQASIWAQQKSGPRSDGGATSGPDGRFELMLSDGDYTIRAVARGYADETAGVSVPSGAAELRLALTRGASLKGRIVDPAGRGVAHLQVTASWSEDGGRSNRRVGKTLPDGSFELKGLAARHCAVLAGSADAGFAFRSGLVPGDASVVLTLQPGGRVRVVVRGPDGQAVPGVWVRLSRVDDAPVWRNGANTDAQGAGVIAVPVGTVEIEAFNGKQRGTARATVPAGGLAAAEITLATDPATSP